MPPDTQENELTPEVREKIAEKVADDLKSLAVLFPAGPAVAQSKIFNNPIPTHYTLIEGGQWLPWKWEGISPEMLHKIPTTKPSGFIRLKSSSGEAAQFHALRFKTGQEWDIHNGWALGTKAHRTELQRP